MEFLTCAVTDVGIAKETNQDSCLIKTANTSIGKVILSVICDGMGGLSKGEIASATVINAFDNWFNNTLPQLIEFGLDDNILRQQWVGLVRDENARIMAYGESHNINLGTTVCAILITQDRLYCMNVGDSRCYEICDEVRQMTVDQTLVQSEVEEGKITAEQAKIDPRRSILLQCVGCSEIVNPEFIFCEPLQNATYMLCSDGFRHEISEEEIFNCFNPNVLDSEATIQNHILYLIESNKQRGETDNITSLIIRTF